MGCACGGWRAEIERRVARMLDITRVLELRDRATGQLSGGLGLDEFDVVFDIYT